MSPELWYEGDRGAASDVSAFGVTLWELMQKLPMQPWGGKPGVYIKGRVLKGGRPEPAVKEPR